MTERGLMARSLAYLFAAGGALAALSLVLPESLEVRDLDLVAPLTAGAAVATVLIASLLVMGSEVLRLWTFQAVLAAGTALITVAIHLSGEVSVLYVMFYVWVTLYAFYFFSRLQAALQLAFLSLAYSLVLFGAKVDAPLAYWVIPVATLTIAGILVATLRERVLGLIARLADAARTDALTGLMNRRGFQELFAIELERARSGGHSLALVVGDIDHFKDVNDRHGHAGGDETLRRLAEVLKASKRRIDVVARIGGEEFAFLMPDSTEQGAYIAAERLRRDVEHAFVDQPGGVTISFGVASFGRHGQTPEALMHSADQALYSAKELGRNRTVIFNAEVSGALAGAASQRVAQRESYLATVMALSEALDLRDAGIAEHSRTVGRYSELTALELGLPAHVVERVRIAGTLLDIGKIGVSESVLNKQGPLDEGEWAEIRRHPEIGARILDSVNAADIRGWVLAHHERPDGRGYPFGAQNGAIPLEAKIIAVAEAYESMTSPHPYRLQLSDEQARDELVRGAGSQFDVDVVQAFLAAVDRSAVLQAAG